jgi:hypothetical protein
MILVDMIYLLIGEIIILLFVPAKKMCMIGFFAGVLYAVFASVQMSFRIRKIVFGRAPERKTTLIGYFIRLAVMLVMFAVLYIFKWGDLLCTIIGMFSMKVSAYLQPFTNKRLAKISKKGR